MLAVLGVYLPPERVKSTGATNQNSVEVRLSAPLRAKKCYMNFTPTSRILLKRAMLRRRGVMLSTMDAAASGPAS